jgi:predicted small secreted protein
MRKLLILVIAAAAVSTAACNTIAGVGKDTSSVGHAVTHSANDAKN